MDITGWWFKASKPQLVSLTETQQVFLRNAHRASNEQALVKHLDSPWLRNVVSAALIPFPFRTTRPFRRNEFDITYSRFRTIWKLNPYFARFLQLLQNITERNRCLTMLKQNFVKDKLDCIDRFLIGMINAHGSPPCKGNPAGWWRDHLQRSQVVDRG